MALEILNTMDYAQFGQPYVRLTKSTSLNDPGTLDYAQFGQPFYFATSSPSGGGGSTPGSGGWGKKVGIKIGFGI